MKDVLKSRKFWIEMVIMTVGMFFGALAVHCFLIPSKLIIGSISGLSIVINDLTGLPVSIVYFFINIVLLALAYLLIGKEFGLKTVYTALILSPWLYLLEHVMPLKESIMGDPWLDLLCFVGILSIGQTVLFRINASTGGLDILAKIINKYLHFDIGVSVSIAGALICSTAFLIHDLKLVIIGLIGTWINGLALNHFTASMNQKKRVCIITKEPKILTDFVINKIGRTATMYEVKGAYSGEKSTEVVTIIARDEFATLMKFIEEKSIDAFITAGNVNEVFGLWDKARKKGLAK